MINLDDPDAVAAELRRLGLPVHRARTRLHTDARLHETFTSARLGGWIAATGKPPRPRHINRGRLTTALKEQ